MQVIVFSAGRSGTNLLLECLSGHSFFSPTDYPEDKLVFMRNIEYPDRYLCKSDTVYLLSYKYFFNFMNKNKNAHILWSIRHPYDWCLSKLYRGRAKEENNWICSEDATIEGCKNDLQYMWAIFEGAEQDFPLRILRVKMEDIILDIKKECKRICKWLCIPYQEEMETPYLRLRNTGKKERYGDKLDTSQINIYKRLPNVYDNYFADKMSDIEELFAWVKPLVKEFGYEE